MLALNSCSTLRSLSWKSWSTSAASAGLNFCWEEVTFLFPPSSIRELSNTSPQGWQFWLLKLLLETFLNDQEACHFNSPYAVQGYEHLWIHLLRSRRYTMSKLKSEQRETFPRTKSSWKSEGTTAASSCFISQCLPGVSALHFHFGYQDPGNAITVQRHRLSYCIK